MARINCTIFVEKKEDGFYLTKICRRVGTIKEDWYLFLDEDEEVCAIMRNKRQIDISLDDRL